MLNILRAISASVLFLLITPIAHAAFIEIQPIQICDDDGNNCATTGFFEAETDKIWAQAGIDVRFLPIQTIDNTDWLDVNYASPLTQEPKDIMAFGRDNINDSDATLAINMFFVDTMTGLFGLGCGGDLFSTFCTNLVGIFITGGVFTFNSNIGRLDTIAHEIGHVLELPHIGGASNLMATGGTRTVPGSINDINPDGLMLSQLSSGEIDTVYTSRFVQVPAPASIYLLLLGLVSLANRRRRSRV